MSRLMAAKLRNRVPMPPKPPALETAAASSPDVQVPIGARMTGASIPNKEQSGVVSMVSTPTHPLGTPDCHYDNRAASRHPRYCGIIIARQPFAARFPLRTPDLDQAC